MFGDFNSAGNHVTVVIVGAFIYLFHVVLSTLDQKRASHSLRDLSIVLAPSITWSLLVLLTRDIRIIDGQLESKWIAAPYYFWTLIITPVIIVRRFIAMRPTLRRVDMLMLVLMTLYWLVSARASMYGILAI